MDGTQPTPAAGFPARQTPSVNSWNAEYIDQLYQVWLEDPQSLDADWQAFFKGFDLGNRMAESGATSPDAKSNLGDSVEAGGNKQSRLSSMTNRYRSLGHRAADLDPLGLRQPSIEDLRLQKFSFGEADLDTLFDPGTVPLPRPAPLRDILELLRDTYCRTIGVEYMHVQDPERRNWLQQRMEADRNHPDYTAEQKLSILRSLIEADGFENFLDRRYKGKKRFGLEGAETLIPMLHEIVNHGPDFGVTEFLIGMAHRGRINVLVNILQKTYEQLFTEFEEAWIDDFLEGGGDVKYHRGFSTDTVTPSGERVHLSLAANPSHLEFGHSVVLGRVRAKQRLRNDTDRKSVVPLLIHGDAAFPGQGIVAECFNMMNLDGYTVGGAIHLIINNQVGFTTNPSDLFSGRYCTDIAKVVEAPIFHINSNDPEAAVHMARLALDYREKFKCDIVLDLWSYRKYGHNEGDEPAFTQPQLYERIRNHKPILNRYVEQLLEQGVITQSQFDELYQSVHNEMDQAQTRAKEAPVDPVIDPFRLQWVGLTEKYSDAAVNTTASMEEL
ncbi:MAG TPA: thiamine pyrophosphate-dependent enzyme, partial [Phycisphaerales bacterium]|nr:thiamine pyrophosphate-dependent enzyme [Phycisphaerales bacterium]